MAAGSIVNFAVALTARTSGFRRGLNSAGKRMNRFATKVGAVGKRLLSFKGAIVAAVGVGGMGLMIRKSAEAIDRLGKLSSALNVSTEALAGYAHAARITGASQAVIEKGIQRLVRTLGDAQAGTLPIAVRAFEDLGLSIEDLGKLRPEDMMKEVAEAISKIESPTLRASRAFQVFGRQGQELMNFLMLGKTGIEEMADESDRLGRAISGIDAIKVESANDAFGNLKSAISGAFEQLTIALAPGIEFVSKKMTDWLTGGIGLTGKMKVAFQVVAGSIGSVMDFVELLKAGFYGFKGVAASTLRMVVELVDLLGEAVVGLVNLLPGVSVKWTAFAKHLGDALTEEVTDAFDKSAEAMEKVRTNFHMNAAINMIGELENAANRRARDVAAKRKAAADAAATAAKLPPGSLKGLLAGIAQTAASAGRGALDRAGALPDVFRDLERKLAMMRGERGDFDQPGAGQRRRDETLREWRERRRSDVRQERIFDEMMIELREQTRLMRDRLQTGMAA